ncbi:MAG: LLM class flavin-dependent oxidoreductase [Myxococcota bacterium]
MTDFKWGALLVMPALPDEDHGQIVRDSLAYARAAEEMGFDDLWTLEHHFTGYGVCGSALTMASYVLGHTKRIKVGTAVCVVPLQHPVRLAEKVNMLDAMSNGRFLFGVGRGLFIKDFKVFGTDIEYNRERMEESMEVIEKIWKNGSAGHKGKYFDFPDVEVFPKLQSKKIPVYTAVNSPSSVEWAAANGYSLMLSHFQDDETRRSQVDLHAEVASEHGYDPDSFDHVISAIAGTAKTSQAIRSASRKRLSWWQSEFFRATELFTEENLKMRGFEWYKRRWESEAIGGKYPVDERVDRDLADNPVGSVQECIDRLSTTIEVTGVKHYMFGFEAVEGGAQPTLESMQQFKEEVLPKVDGAMAA